MSSIAPGKCNVCQNHIPSEEVWNMIHVGPNRETRLDICKNCSERGYHFWSGEIYSMPGTPSADERIFGLRRFKEKRGRKSA